MGNPGSAPPAPALGRNGPGPALVIRGISKHFLGTPALVDLDLTVEAGSIHALIGQNGSGKSTLIKILSGYHLPDHGGLVSLAGTPLQFGSAAAAYRQGFRFVHQNLGLISAASVLDNLSYTGGYPTRLGTIKFKAAARAARAALERVGLSLDLHAAVGDLPAAEQTAVAIARAIRVDGAHPAHALILDEPTAALPPDEVDQLLTILKSAASSGVAVLLVTHRLDEVHRAADHVTILRDGRQVGSFRTAEVDRAAMVHLLLGDAVHEVSREAAAGPESETRPALSVRSLQRPDLGGLSFDVLPGEVLGLAGLTGSGRESVLGSIFGALSRQSGDVTIRGGRLAPLRPDLAIAGGLGFLPADRAAYGGVMSLSSAENMSLVNLRPYWSRLILRKRPELTAVGGWFQRLGIRPPHGVQLPLAALSGGNQQKVLLAKWLQLSPPVMLLDEPTQGVDVGAQADIHDQILALAAKGVAVVISSTDMDELSRLCDRILVLNSGRIADELIGPGLSVRTITTAIMSEPTNA